MTMHEPDLLRGLIDGEREALTPTAGAQKATWAAVAQSLGEGAAPIVDPKLITGPASASSGIGSWLKIIVALTLGGAGAAGIVAATEEAPTERPAVVAAAEPAPAPVARAPAVDPRPQAPPELPVVEGIGPTEEAVVPPAPIELAIEVSPPDGELLPAKREGKAGRAHAAPGRHRDEHEATPASALAEEARLVAAARRALGSGAHGEALARLAEHARRFPSGQLTEDRLALRARVHCARGDFEQGRRAAVELRRAFPRSSQHARIDRDCKRHE